MEVAAAEATQLSIARVKQLKIRLRDLTAATNDVQTLVDAALARNEFIKREVRTWLTRSTDAQNMATKLIDEAQNGNTTSSWMYTCSKLDTVIQALLNKRQTANRIIEALKDDEISIVGIYGMAGVGKTVLLNSIYQHFKRDPSYDHVVIVTISKHLDLRRIQGNLANQLNLQLQEEESISFRAKLLLQKVNGGDENVLIFLDDLWEKMDLTQVGIIPCKNCKIVFATRSQSVYDLMEAQRTFQVDILSQEDSIRLLRSSTGNIPDSDLVEQITELCKGVPLAIVIIGQVLQGQNRSFWMFALRVLKSSLITDITSGPIAKAVLLSYFCLPTEARKMCFLFCCFFPEDFKIPYSTLLNYMVGEKLIQNADTLEESRNNLNATIDKLTSQSLLLKSGQDCVMMHDIVRQVGTVIGFPEPYVFLVKAGMGFTQWPTMNLDKCKRLSLMHNKLGGDLPTQVSAPQLSTLSLHGNLNLKKIPDDFFHKMEGLLTLDLSETCIMSLPQSLSRLVNLRTLCLDRCYYLNNITPVQKLGALEILTLSQTQMKRLPNEIKGLVSLKLLDLSMAPNLVIIPPGVISSMLHLEELNMKDNFSQWQVEGSGDGRNVALSEIATLKHLACLKLRVENLKCLSEDMLQHWESLKRFEILFGSIVSSSP